MLNETQVDATTDVMPRVMNEKQMRTLDNIGDQHPTATVVGWSTGFHSPKIRIPGKPALQIVHPDTGRLNGVTPS